VLCKSDLRLLSCPSDLFLRQRTKQSVRGATIREVDEELALFIATEITTHWNAIGNSLNNGNQLIENKKKGGGETGVLSRAM
jgi:hypothetical protein